MSNNENQGMSEEEKRNLRNSIFAAQQAVENSGPAAISREEYARQEIGLDIPVDAVPLPSAGKIYPPGHSLHAKDRVEFRTMTAREEDILMSRAYIKKGTVITE